MSGKTIAQAVTEALDYKLKTDEKTLIFGEDVGVNGGVFRITDGLQAKYGDKRVLDTPLAESGILGLAIGLAAEGFRPIPEIQFLSFILEGFDAVYSQLARFRYRSGNTRNPYDAKGLLISSIESNDPVIFLEHLRMYRSIKGEVPDEGYRVPLDKASVVREGTDVSIITYGLMVHYSLKAAEQLEKEGISVEVVDLRTISPVDMETIISSVKKTGRVIVVQESQRQAGVAGQLLSEISERAFMYLDAPVGRVTSPDTTFSFGLAEEYWLPTPTDIVNKVKEVYDF